MPVIPDPKKEAFAQLIARGLPVIEAYTRAGFKRNTGNASALKKRPEVTARIADLQYEMATSNHAELTAYLKSSRLNPTFIITNLVELAQEAKEAGQFAIAAKCFKDLGAELFGMFVERKGTLTDPTLPDVHASTTTTINITQLNSALETFGDEGPRKLEIDGHATAVERTGPSLPILALEYEE